MIHDKCVNCISSWSYESRQLWRILLEIANDNKFAHMIQIISADSGPWIKNKTTTTIPSKFFLYSNVIKKYRMEEGVLKGFHHYNVINLLRTLSSINQLG